MPFSQLTPLPAVAAKDWLSLLSAVAGSTAALVVIFRRRPSIDAEFATKTELHASEAVAGEQLTRLESRLGRDIRRLFDKLEQTKDEMLADSRERGREIDERLGELSAQVARLDERSHK
jgi:hypothetical protein